MYRDMITQNKIMRDALEKLSAYDLADSDPFASSVFRQWSTEALEQCDNLKIFSGRGSEDMWKDIKKAKTKEDLRGALYFVCCRIQELESKYDKALAEIREHL